MIQHLEERIVEARSRGATPSSTTTNGDKSIKLPDPAVFMGAADQNFDNWLSKIRRKLSANADHYITDALRIAYVESRVDGPAGKHLAPRLRETSANQFCTADEMLEVLEKVYADPNHELTA